MSVAQRLGVLLRRDASLTSIRGVRQRDARRAERNGVTPDELLARRFAARVAQVEARVSTLEEEVLGQQ